MAIQSAAVNQDNWMRNAAGDEPLQKERIEAEAASVTVKIGNLEITTDENGYCYSFKLDGKELRNITKCNLSCDFEDRIWRFSAEHIVDTRIK
jgi:hypothetical protein